MSRNRERLTLPRKPRETGGPTRIRPCLIRSGHAWVYLEPIRIVDRPNPSEMCAYRMQKHKNNCRILMLHVMPWQACMHGPMPRCLIPRRITRISWASILDKRCLGGGGFSRQLNVSRHLTRRNVCENNAEQTRFFIMYHTRRHFHICLISYGAAPRFQPGTSLQANF